MAGSRTLARTLAALSGLRNSIAEVIVYVQERDEDLMSVAERFTDRVYGFDRRIGKGNAWLYLANAAKCKHVLFLEDDFVREYRSLAELDVDDDCGFLRHLKRRNVLFASQ